MGQDITMLLAQAHEIMKNRYIQDSIVAKDVQDAKILEQFLSTLKQRAYSYKTLPGSERMTQDIYDIILNNVVLPKGRTLYNLFRRTGKSWKQGALFEQDFAAIIQSVMRTANPGAKVRMSDINIGSVVGTTDINTFNSKVQQLMDTTVTDVIAATVQEIRSKQSKFVFGKIDTVVHDKIINLNANVTFPNGVLEALSQATFTDKSYRSISWRNKQRIELGDRMITLGNSDPKRAVLGSMRALGFKQSEFETVFFGGQSLFQQTKNKKIAEHIYHLRYMYELTGAGTLYINQNGLEAGARFMVYNDPTSNVITVVATSKIIQDLLTSKEVPDNPFGSIGISSAYLKAVNKT